MDSDMREYILNFYDEAVKKYYPDPKKDGMQALFKFYD